MLALSPTLLGSQTTPSGWTTFTPIWTPLEQEQAAYDWSTLSLDFTSSQDGILLHATGIGAQHFGVELVGGSMLATVISGDGDVRTAVIYSAETGGLANGRWHRLTVLKGAGALSLTVDTNVATLPWAPDVVPLDGPVAIGGLPVWQYSTVLQFTGRDGFRGCVRDLTVDGAALNLLELVDGPESVIMGCPRENFCSSSPCGAHGSCHNAWTGFECECDPGFEGQRCTVEVKALTFKFGAHSEVKFAPIFIDGPPSNGLGHGGASLSAMFRSRQPGTILHVPDEVPARNEHFLTVRIDTDGALEVLGRFAGSTVQAASSQPVIDGAWHVVTVSQPHQGASSLAIALDDAASFELALDGAGAETAVRFELDGSPVFIGGRNGTFEGCIKDLRVGGEQISFDDELRSDRFQIAHLHLLGKAAAARGCMGADVCAAEVNPCPVAAAVCVDAWNTATCDCVAGWGPAGLCTALVDECDASSCPDGSFCVTKPPCDASLPELEACTQMRRPGFTCQQHTVCDAGSFQRVAPSATADAECVPLRVCSAQQYETAAPVLDSRRVAITDRSCEDLSSCELASQFEASAPTATSDRRCDACSACDADHYILSPCSDFADTQCAPCVPCSSQTHFERAACTSVHDTVCAELTVCSAEQFEVQAPTATSDRQCVAASACDLTEEYEERPLSPSSDRKCGPLSTCGPNEYEAAAPTLTSDRVCRACTSCEFGQYREALCSATADTICHDCDVCGEGRCFASAHVGFWCECPSNLLGERCEQVNGCVSYSTRKLYETGVYASPCGGAGRCVSNESSALGFSCVCSQGWSGQRCELKDCISPGGMDDPCRPHTHATTCIPDDAAGHRCNCSPGWAGATCAEREAGCVDEPCVHGACDGNADGQGFTCLCDEGYAGPLCDQAVRTSSTTTVTPGGTRVPEDDATEATQSDDTTWIVVAVSSIGCMAVLLLALVVIYVRRSGKGTYATEECTSSHQANLFVDEFRRAGSQMSFVPGAWGASRPVSVLSGPAHDANNPAATSC